MAESSTPACSKSRPSEAAISSLGVNKVWCANVRPALDAQIDITKPKLRDAPQGLIKRMLRETERGTSDVQHSELLSLLI